MKISLFLFLIGLSTYSFSQSTLPQSPSKETQIGILKALNVAKPNLGMTVLSVENGYHVLMSNNGRYMIKGTLLDFWDGVHESKVVNESIKMLPTSIEPDQYYVQFGNPEGKKLYSFIKFGCNSCREVAESLLSKQALEHYDINVMLLHNDEESKRLASHIYCSKDKLEAFRTVFSRTTMPTDTLLMDCTNDVTSSTPTAANIQGIKALPYTYFPERSYGVLGEMFDYL